ncbi:MAG: hypothetical protein FPO08_04420 [Geobacter sp.]|nr:MAG: hypothetical protein FPO08_04420 [Geobacter sp.]
MEGVCRLCQNQKELRLSHIIPKFVYSWFKRTSVSSLRMLDNPNKRIQDGAKEYLLCAECEQLLNKWETPFCNNIFLKVQNKEIKNEGMSYDRWALKFATSVSWRVFNYYAKEDNDHLSPEQQKSAEMANETWRKFILGELPHPGEFQQHILLVDAIQSHTAPKLSPFINRYFLSSIDMDIVATDDYAFVYTKFFRIIVFGFIHGREHKLWQGTKINAYSGVIGGCDSRIASEVIEFMNKRADIVFESQSDLSQKQQDKIADLFSNNPEMIAGAEISRAMAYDYMHSGEKAFYKKDGGKEQDD